MSAMARPFVLPLRPTILALTVGLLCAVVLAIATIAYLRTGSALEILVDEHLDVIAESTETKVEHLLDDAPRILAEVAILAERDLLPHDERKLGALLVERMRQVGALGWLGYADRATSTFTGGRRNQDHVLVYSHADPSVNGGIPSQFTITAEGSWTALPAAEPRPYDPTTRPWFIGALQHPGLRWLEPYRFADGAWGISITKGIVRDNAVSGVLLADFFLTGLVGQLHDIRVGQTGRVYIVTPGGVVLGAESEAVAANVRAAMASPAGTPVTIDGESQRVVVRAMKNAGGPNWTVTVLVPEAELSGVVTENVHLTVLLGLVALLVGMLGASWFSGLISGPIREMSTDLGRLAVFDLPERQTPRSSIAEIAQMAEALDRTKAGLQSFSRYVPVGLVRQLLADGREAKLGGEHRVLTIVFSDIEGFTPLVESTPVPIVLEALGEYNEKMNTAIERMGGAIVNYMGDGFMAIFGAPVALEDHALRACRAALEMRQLAQDMVDFAQAHGAPVLRTRIGVNTGDVVVGNIGAPERFAYSALGDAVNTSARLEGLNKQYGTQILIGEQTAAALGDALVTRPVDVVRMKGKQLPVLVHELVGEPGDVSAARLDAIKTYMSAYSLYRERRFEEALVGFEAVDEALGGDGASQSFAARSRAFLVEPPPPDWDGTVVMTVK
jgi:adenylate cyclase